MGHHVADIRVTETPSSQPRIAGSDGCPKLSCTVHGRVVLNGKKKKSVPEPVFPKKPAGTPCAQPWLVAVGGWRLVAAGCWRRLVAGGWWRLAVDGSWRLAVGGPLGRSLRAVLNKKKTIWSLKDRPGPCSGRELGGRGGGGAPLRLPLKKTEPRVSWGVSTQTPGICETAPLFRIRTGCRTDMKACWTAGPWSGLGPEPHPFRCRIAPADCPPPPPARPSLRRSSH